MSGKLSFFFIFRFCTPSSFYSPFFQIFSICKASQSFYFIGCFVKLTKSAVWFSHTDTIKPLIHCLQFSQTKMVASVCLCINLAMWPFLIIYDHGQVLALNEGRAHMDISCAIGSRHPLQPCFCRSLNWFFFLKARKQEASFGVDCNHKMKHTGKARFSYYLRSCYIGYRILLFHKAFKHWFFFFKKKPYLFHLRTVPEASTMR